MHHDADLNDSKSIHKCQKSVFLNSNNVKFSLNEKAELGSAAPAGQSMGDGRITKTCCSENIVVKTLFYMLFGGFPRV